jgi:hypothetical protein
VAESGGHMFELPLALGSQVGKCRHAREHHVAVRDGGDGRLVFHAVDMTFFFNGFDGF